MSEIDFGSEIIEIKNHTAAMMQVITSIRQDSSRRFNEMEKLFQTFLKSNVDLNQKINEVMKSNVELISLNKNGFYNGQRQVGTIIVYEQRNAVNADDTVYFFLV